MLLPCEKILVDRFVAVMQGREPNAWERWDATARFIDAAYQCAKALDDLKNTGQTESNDEGR